MEYFTLANDLEEAKSLTTKKKIWILSMGLLTAFLLLRGFGAITIEFYKGCFRENHEIKKDITEYFDGGTRVSENTKHSEIKNETKESYRNFGFSLGFPRFDSLPENSTYQVKETSYLEKLIRKEIAKNKTLGNNFESAAISLKKFEMSGLYWFPLVKAGESSYQILIENSYYQDTYFADFSGSIDFEVYGFCTRDVLEQTISEKIAKTVVKSIEDDYKK